MRKFTRLAIIAIGLLAALPSHSQTSRSPDFDGDGQVGFSDFVLFAAVFGSSQGDGAYAAKYDLDGDGAVGFSDFVILTGLFGRPATPVEAFCDDEYLLKTTGFTYSNNAWGKGDITDYEQCLLKRVAGDSTTYGWRWRWPLGPGGTGIVKAYPEVIFGHKPLGHPPVPRTAPDLPRRISDVERLRVDFDVEMTVQGFYNLAFEMWIVSDVCPELDEKNITHEVMIWMDRTIGPNTEGVEHKVAEIDGAVYDVYFDYDLEHAGSGTESVTITFLSREKRRRGTLDLLKFLHYLVDENRLSSDRYVTSVELGNEIVEGTGEVWLKRYVIDVEYGDSDCWREQTREALVALYDATDGDNWTDNTNWLTDKDISTWYGVEVCDCRITGLDLSENNLKGRISPELGKLTDLSYLLLNGNELEGPVPVELGNLTSLITVSFGWNPLSGQLPQSLTGLTELELFHFESTGLCAPLDTAFQAWLRGIEDTNGPNCSR